MAAINPHDHDDDDDENDENEKVVTSQLRKLEAMTRQAATERQQGEAKTVRAAACECPDFHPWGPLEEQWLPVLVAADVAPGQLRDEEQAVLVECLALSVELLNARLGRQMFVFAGNRPARLPASASATSALLYVTADLKTTAHGITDLYHDPASGRASCSVLPHSHSRKKKKNKSQLVADKGASAFVRSMAACHPCIHMQLRPKRQLPVDQRRRQYVSTLTHELLHGVGFGHIRAVASEMMSVARGGSCICHSCPWPPVLYPSPLTTVAFRWLYSPLAQLLISELGGFPIHCAHCFTCGWRW